MHSTGVDKDIKDSVKDVEFVLKVKGRDSQGVFDKISSGGHSARSTLCTCADQKITDTFWVN